MTLRRLKALLKYNGMILINEISDRSVFTHLTFGLLDGWWSYEDAELRIPGSPGLYPKSWECVLHSEGYRAVCFPAETAHDLGQQIIAAESDGLVRMQGIRDGRKPYAAPAEVFRKPAQPVSAAARQRSIKLLRLMGNRSLPVSALSSKQVLPMY